MKKIHLLLIALLLVALPKITLAQANVVNFDSVLTGRHDTVPAQLAGKGLVICHVDVDSVNSCSYGYHHRARLDGSDDTIVVGRLTQSTTMTIRVSGNDSPGMSLAIESSPNKYGPYSPVSFTYSSAGPCYTLLTDMVDQNFYVRIYSINGKTVRIRTIETDNGLLPVELVAFSGARTGDNVQLKWQTKTETNNYGFEVQKFMNGEFQKIDFVQGHGTVNTPQDYSYIDGGAGQAELKYRLKQIDRDGKFKHSNVITVATNTDKSLTLLQAAPNPFNPQTTIYYSLGEDEVITMFITDFYGREVRSLVNTTQPAGNYSVVFTATELPSGTYFVWLKSETKSSFLRIELTK